MFTHVKLVSKCIICVFLLTCTWIVHACIATCMLEWESNIRTLQPPGGRSVMSPYTPMFVPGFTETEEVHVIFFWGGNHLQVVDLSISISTMTFSVAGEGGLGLISCSCNSRALFQSIDWLLLAKYFTFSSAWNCAISVAAQLGKGLPARDFHQCLVEDLPTAPKSSGWWFGTWLLCFHSVGNVIIPTDKLHHFSE